jgi:Raf kinase inhibitor-like YbhB/YbcL family protein
MIKRIFGLVAITALLMVIFNGCGEQQSEEQPEDRTEAPSNQSIMQLSSSEFQNNEPIPSKYTCNGSDISPPLAITDTLKDAVSLALIIDDPDAPMGTWVHWIVWNIDPKTTEIAEGSAPSGAVEGKTDFGRSGYGGPCPPSGTHRYFFKLYALDTELDLDPSSEKKDLEKAMKEHIIDQTEIIGTYSQS